MGIGKVRRSGKAVLLALATICALAVCAGCSGTVPEDRLAARYDGGVVTEDEVTAYTAGFRASHAYSDDDIWALYLYDEGLTTETWRNRAIGAIVEERLLDGEADKAGIVPDEDRIAAQIASDKEAAGIAAQDDEAWRRYLETLGTDERGYREQLEKVSRHSQLLSREIALDEVADRQVFDDYIEGNLISRVVRRYAALVYPTEAEALEALAELQGLSGAQLEERFAQLAGADDSDSTTAENGGDRGWDIVDYFSAFSQQLGDEMLDAGALSTVVHEFDGQYYVVMCAKRFVFEAGTDYNSLPDADLSAFVRSEATSSNWSQLQSDYIAGLREQAHVQVCSMPEGLPYDVDEKIAQLKEGQGAMS